MAARWVRLILPLQVSPWSSCRRPASTLVSLVCQPQTTAGRLPVRKTVTLTRAVSSFAAKPRQACHARDSLLRPSKEGSLSRPQGAVRYFLGWMGQNTSLPAELRVVVVGGGYGGSKFCLDLLSDKTPFTLVDGRDAFHHNLASVRAMAVPGLAKRMMMPFEGTFGEHFRRAKVIDVDPAAKVVKLEGGDELPYDLLVLATGTNGPFPFKFGLESKADVVERYEEYAKKVMASQRIALIGGGAVGVESAAEIATEYPDKEVTLIHSQMELVAPGLNPDFQKKAVDVLKLLNVKTILGEKVVNLEEVGEGPGTVVTDKGNKVEVDLVIKCTGLSVNTEAFATSLKESMGPRGCLKVNEFFQVVGCEDVYAIGDCCGIGDPWLAHVAQEHAKKLMENLKRKYCGADMEPYVGDSTSMEIAMSMGRNHGVGQKKSGGMLPEFVVKNVKCRDLLINRYWQVMRQREH